MDTATLEIASSDRLAKRSIFRGVPVLSMIVLIVFLVCGIFGSLIAPHDPLEQDLLERQLPPTWVDGGSPDHILGTDSLGRDMLSRLIVGASTSLYVVIGGLLLSAVIGAAIGFVAGYAGGRLDIILMRIVDAALALPGLLFALLFAIVFRPGILTVIAIVGIVSWPRFARMMRAEALMIKDRDYVRAARISGVTHARILVAHVLPNAFNTLLVLVTLGIGWVMLFEATLSFLGAGVPPPAPSWGQMTAQGRDYLVSNPWNAVLPGLAIMVVVLASNFFGDWVRDRLDPKLREL